jgi:cytochrome c-type biogenesis protein CcmF
MTIAHIGVAIIIAGITGVSMWQEEKIQLMNIGDDVSVGGYSLRLGDVKTISGQNYSAEQATFMVFLNGNKVAELQPEKRVYLVRKQPTTEAAIQSGFFGDLYAVIGDRSENGGWTTRIYYKPMVAWLWIGALLLSFGGLISVFDKRFRKKNPKTVQAINEPIVANV